MPVVTADLKFRNPYYFNDLITANLWINELLKQVFFKYLITKELKKVVYGNMWAVFLWRKKLDLKMSKKFNFRNSLINVGI